MILHDFTFLVSNHDWRTPENFASHFVMTWRSFSKTACWNFVVIPNLGDIRNMCRNPDSPIPIYVNKFFLQHLFGVRDVKYQTQQ